MGAVQPQPGRVGVLTLAEVLAFFTIAGVALAWGTLFLVFALIVGLDSRGSHGWTLPALLLEGPGGGHAAWASPTAIGAGIGLIVGVWVCGGLVRGALAERRL